jgi:phosphohistidine phosphatase
MKRLLLLRHAKSSWDGPAGEDHERPLNRRGEKAAERIGAWLRERRITPDLVLCSTAKRTRQTLDGLMPFAGATPAVELLPSLYLAAPPAILERIRKVPDENDSVMVIGHNPGFEQLATLLAGDGEAVALAQLAKKFPTGTLADLRFDIKQWREVTPNEGRLAAFVRPRDLD